MTDTQTSVVGERIVALLGARSQVDLAEGIGMPAPTLNKIIKGTRRIQGDELVDVARWIGVEPLELLREPVEEEVFFRADADPAAREQVTGRCFDLIENYLRLDALAGRV